MRVNFLLLGVLCLAVLSFSTWGVSLGALVALQCSCGSDFHPGSAFGISLPCYRIFRWEWFIIGFEFVCAVGVLVIVLLNKYNKYRQSFLGLTAMVTVLYIILADRWYTFSNQDGLSGNLELRVQIMSAGTIMVSAVNCLLVFALGMEEEKPAAADARPAADTKPKAVADARPAADAKPAADAVKANAV